MILVDSTVWIDFFNGRLTAQTDALDGLLGDDIVVMGDLVLVEVLQGFRHDRDVQKARDLFEPLEFRQLGGRDIALATVKNYRLLRKKGVTVRKTIDVIIATWCIKNSVSLLHSDRDFEPLVTHCGLKSVHPAVQG